MAKKIQINCIGCGVKMPPVVIYKSYPVNKLCTECYPTFTRLAEAMARSQ